MFYSTETVLDLYRAMQTDRDRRMQRLARHHRRPRRQVGTASDTSRIAALAAAR